MKMKYSVAAALLLAAAASEGADAQRIALPGPYVGVDIGYTSGRVDKATTKKEVCQNDPACMVIESTKETNSYGVKAFGGYLFNQYFALEGGYYNLGEVSFEDKTNTGETYKGTASTQGIFFEAVGHLPIYDELSLFGRVGLSYAEMAKNYDYSGGTLIVDGSPKDMSADVWGMGYQYGIGFQYDFSPRLGARAEWEGFHVQEEDSDSGFDVNMLAIGIVYRFGPEPEREEPEPVIVVKEVPVPAEPKIVEVETIVEKEVVKEIPAEPVIITKPTERVVLAANTLFDFDKSNVKAEGRAALMELAQKLQRNDRLVVIGHTDSMGSDAYNMKLSQRRADAVRNQLIAFGVPAQNIETRAMGESEPVASNATDEGRQANRRVVIDIYAAPKAPAEAIDSGAGE